MAGDKFLKTTNMKRGTIVMVKLTGEAARFTGSYFYKGMGIHNTSIKIKPLSHIDLYTCREVFHLNSSFKSTWSMTRVCLMEISNEVGELVDRSVREPGYPEDMFTIVWEPDEEDETCDLLHAF